VRGNEAQLLTRIRDRFRGIRDEIARLEQVRAEALSRRERFLAERDRLQEEGQQEEAVAASREAGKASRLAFHSLVNIRFLVLSSIGLRDTAKRIYEGVEEPSRDLTVLFGEINLIYEGISAKYIVKGDRERLEKTVEKRSGCSSLF
jgi:hypothetical protein